MKFEAIWTTFQTSAFTMRRRDLFVFRSAQWLDCQLAIIKRWITSGQMQIVKVKYLLSTRRSHDCVCHLLCLLIASLPFCSTTEPEQCPAVVPKKRRRVLVRTK
ncbi:hypothetical protein ARMSODRAFT_805408 [Armillaria solidipes]|uniref:Uncharacterized protein n=1 Tax=Armillaria solidipes TaxID=1076256 RepID=A0A2H3AZU8_9AGAR|nr:hypothetical protein ARMSODRAFT_805408 [Armillaria solidipes]